MSPEHDGPGAEDGESPDSERGSQAVTGQDMALQHCSTSTTGSEASADALTTPQTSTKAVSGGEGPPPAHDKRGSLGKRCFEDGAGAVDVSVDSANLESPLDVASDDFEGTMSDGKDLQNLARVHEETNVEEEWIVNSEEDGETRASALHGYHR